MEWHAIREALRWARDHALPAPMTLDEAAAATGLDRSTIHSIENTKREPALKPKLDTILKLVQAYGFTLSSFFAQVEDKKGPERPLATPTGTAMAVQSGESILPSALSDALLNEVAAAPSKDEALRQLAQAVVPFLLPLIDRGDAPHRQVPDPSPSRSKSRKIRRPSHRRDFDR